MMLTDQSLNILERLTLTKEKIGRRDIIITDITLAKDLLLLRANQRNEVKKYNRDFLDHRTFTGLVGEYSCMKFLQENQISFEYDENDYSDRGDDGYDFRLSNNLTIDSKCKQEGFRSEGAMYEYIQSSPLVSINSGILVADYFLLGYYCPALAKHYLIGTITKDSLASYKDGPVYTPYMSRFKNINEVLNQWHQTF